MMCWHREQPRRMSVASTTLQVLVALACWLLAAPVAAEAQRPAKVPRIGLLSLATPEAAFLAMIRERPDALLILGDIVFLVHRARLADLAVKSGLPSITGLREHAEAGTLLAYGPSLPDMYRRAATHVDKILKGAKPADLPVEQPMKFELVLNLKTAKALGLKIPQTVLIRADQVIQ
jgi:ABC-type uncharacterized transport system substrate-binding protein